MFIILDTEDLYTEITRQIVTRYGGKIPYTWEIKSRLMGLMGRESACAIVQVLQLPIEPEDYMAALQEMVPLSFPSCEFLPGQLVLTHATTKSFFVLFLCAWNICRLFLREWISY